METKDAIFNRRSCREYTEQKVTHEILKDLLHAAFSAPTAVNAQPWEYVVIDDEAILWQQYDPDRKHRTKDKPVVGHYSQNPNM